MPSRFHLLRLPARGWLAAFAAALGSCAGATVAAGAEPAPAATPPAPSPDAVYLPPEDPAELLRMDAAMRQFFAGRILASHPNGARLGEIIAAIIQPKHLGFIYDGEGTFDAGESFRRRRGNCLSFALLVTAVARAHGFKTSFQRVDLPVRWDRFGDTVAAVQHVNVRVETNEGMFVVDLRPDLVPANDRHSTSVVADERVAAFFYSDVGVFLLIRGRPEEARRAMVRATQIDPGCASAWANLASLYAQLGDLPTARTCFERSLGIDRGGVNALIGFVDVLHRLGSPEDLRLAGDWERRAQRLRERNPYHHEELARRAREKADWNAAEKHLRRAIALKDDEPEFYEGWITALRQLGRDDDAQRAATKLERLRKGLESRPAYLAP